MWLRRTGRGICAYRGGPFFPIAHDLCLSPLKHNGGRVLVFMVGAFAEMPEDVSCICDIIAHDLARTHVSYYNDDAKRTKGMYRQRTQKALGHRARFLASGCVVKSTPVVDRAKHYRAARPRPNLALLVTRILPSPKWPRAVRACGL